MKSSKPDPFIEQFFARIPPKTAATFNPNQLDILKQTFGNRASKKHAVDLRLSMPFPKGGFYWVLLMGREKRSRDRIQQERHKHPLWTVANGLVISGFLLMIATALLGTVFILQERTDVPTNSEINNVVKE
ncbi:MAG: hypothetical protein RID53_13575 [Coleofasciculus sp. B1-GNL1-01]|uniref:hypothetical protein n=1 Tax=Coleofasciculus sp. B1-GNL1-01 TaxID=3068484 RepID=UPI0033006D2F